jgi:hypothetical protein
VPGLLPTVSDNLTQVFRAHLQVISVTPIMGVVLKELSLEQGKSINHPNSLMNYCFDFPGVWMAQRE